MIVNMTKVFTDWSYMFETSKNDAWLGYMINEV